MNTRQGSLANIVAALCSFFIPGLGQLVQGRPFTALVHFVTCALLWLILLGWIMHLWSILDAALFRPAWSRCEDWRYRCDRYGYRTCA